MSTYQHNKNSYTNYGSDGIPKLEQLDKIDDVLATTDAIEMENSIFKNILTITKILNCIYKRLCENYFLTNDEIELLIYALKFVDTMNLFMNKQSIEQISGLIYEINEIIFSMQDFEAKEMILKKIRYTEMTIIYFKKKIFKNLFFGDGKVLGNEIEKCLELVTQNGTFDQKTFKQMQNIFWVVQGKIDEKYRSDIQTKMSDLKVISLRHKNEKYSINDDYKDYTNLKNYSNDDYYDNFNEDNSNNMNNLNLNTDGSNQNPNMIGNNYPYYMKSYDNNSFNYNNNYDNAYYHGKKTIATNKQGNYKNRYYNQNNPNANKSNTYLVEIPSSNVNANTTNATVNPIADQSTTEVNTTKPVNANVTNFTVISNQCNNSTNKKEVVPNYSAHEEKNNHGEITQNVLNANTVTINNAKEYSDHVERDNAANKLDSQNKGNSHGPKHIQNYYNDNFFKNYVYYYEKPVTGASSSKDPNTTSTPQNTAQINLTSSNISTTINNNPGSLNQISTSSIEANITSNLNANANNSTPIKINNNPNKLQKNKYKRNKATTYEQALSSDNNYINTSKATVNYPVTANNVPAKSEDQSQSKPETEAVKNTIENKKNNTDIEKEKEKADFEEKSKKSESNSDINQATSSQHNSSVLSEASGNQVQNPNYGKKGYNSTYNNYKNNYKNYNVAYSNNYNYNYNNSNYYTKNNYYNNPSNVNNPSYDYNYNNYAGSYKTYKNESDSNYNATNSSAIPITNNSSKDDSTNVNSLNSQTNANQQYNYNYSNQNNYKKNGLNYNIGANMNVQNNNYYNNNTNNARTKSNTFSNKNKNSYDYNNENSNSNKEIDSEKQGDAENIEEKNNRRESNYNEEQNLGDYVGLNVHSQREDGSEQKVSKIHSTIENQKEEITSSIPVEHILEGEIKLKQKLDEIPSIKENCNNINECHNINSQEIIDSNQNNHKDLNIVNSQKQITENSNQENEQFKVDNIFSNSMRPRHDSIYKDQESALVNRKELVNMDVEKMFASDNLARNMDSDVYNEEHYQYDEEDEESVEEEDFEENDEEDENEEIQNIIENEIEQLNACIAENQMNEEDEDGDSDSGDNNLIQAEFDKFMKESKIGMANNPDFNMKNNEDNYYGKEEKTKNNKIIFEDDEHTSQTNPQKETERKENEEIVDNKAIEVTTSEINQQTRKISENNNSDNNSHPNLSEEKNMKDTTKRFMDSLKNIDPKLLMEIKNKINENNKENEKTQPMNQINTQFTQFNQSNLQSQNFQNASTPMYPSSHINPLNMDASTPGQATSQNQISYEDYIKQQQQMNFSGMNNKLQLQNFIFTNYSHFFYRGRDSNIHREYFALKCLEQENSSIITNNLDIFEKKVLIPIYQRINYNVNKKKGIYLYTFTKYKKLIYRVLSKEKILKKVKPYGSYMNNFLIDSGDIDICIVPKCNILEFSSSLEKIKEEIMTNNFGEHKLTHHTSRYMLLKIVDNQTKFVIDITVHNMLPILNTNLLRLYSLYDQRFHITGLYIKHWSKINKIHGAADNYLSSYAMLLMLIYFLQNVVEPKVLPNLQKVESKESFYEYNQNGEMVKINIYYEEDVQKIRNHMNTINSGRENKESATQLLLKFFEFYSHYFDSFEQKIAIHKSPSELLKKSHDNIAFSIEDPFDPQHNPGKSMTINSNQYNKFITSMKKEINYIMNGEYIKRLDKMNCGNN